jgi:ATP-dependent DNA ligase
MPQQSSPVKINSLHHRLFQLAIVSSSGEAERVVFRLGRPCATACMLVAGFILMNEMPLPHFQPMPLARLSEPFSHPDWIFEIKWDGFRSLLYSSRDGVRLVSRNGNAFKSFPALCEGLARDLNGRRCVLDGEIVCLEPHGQTQFRDLLFRRAEPYFYAFDILWDKHAWSDDEHERRRFRKGEDVRYLPLIDRKLRLRAVVPSRAERLLYCDYLNERGEALFHAACEHDLEGVIAKQKHSPYLPDRDTTWFKIRNRSYSQWNGRDELFERRYEAKGAPEIGWNACAKAARSA